MPLVKALYQRLIAERGQEVAFWVLSAFLPTFIIARMAVYLHVPIFIVAHHTHIHHLTYGIIILAIAGYLALTVRTPRWQPWIAASYGIGLALAFDEFGMWLNLQDNYWVRQSYDALLIIIVLLINAVYFSEFWQRLLRHFFHMLRVRT